MTQKQEQWGESAVTHPDYIAEQKEKTNKLRGMLEQAQKQEPVAFPRQTGNSTWTIDTAFIWRVKHTIDPDTPNDFTPSEEQIETVLLALEKIPAGLFTSPPQRQWVGLTDEEMHAVTHENPTPWSVIVWFKTIEAKLKEKNT